MTCDKTIYPTKELAIGAIVGHNTRKKRNSKQKLRGAYFCQGCNGWHVHTQRKRRPGWVEAKTDHTIEVRHIPNQDEPLIIHRKLKIK